jgi:hypothetical protein
MRKNKKRKSLNKASDSRTYTMVLKNTDQYCYICCRRAGVYHAYCGPEGNSKGRENRSWKNHRRNQWKE